MSIKAERTIVTMTEWFEAEGIDEYYERLLDLLEQDMNFDDIQEVYFEQDMDQSEFKVKVIATRHLGGHGIRGAGSDTDLVFVIDYFTQSPPRDSENGLFAAVEMDLEAKLEVSMPGNESWLHSVLRRIWFTNLFREQFRYWVELTQEEVKRFLNETRAFFGLEPVVRKPRRMKYEPLEYSI